jgi:hypothetical protein
MLQSLKPPFGITLDAIGRLLRQPIGGGSAPAAPTPAKRSSERSMRRRQMRRDLYTLLEKYPASRAAMRHLDLVERTLRHGNYEAVQRLPLKVLVRALEEMESLVWDWSPAGLADFRSRLAVTVKQRVNGLSEQTETVAPDLADERYDSTREAGPDVTEVSHEVYEETERSWTGHMPLDLIEAQRAAKATGSASEPGAE